MRPTTRSIIPCLIVLLLASACGSEVDQQGKPVAGNEQTAAVQTARVSDIVAVPAEFAGRSVSVSGTVEKVVAPGVIEMREQTTLEGGVDSRLLVVARHLDDRGVDDSWVDEEVRSDGEIRVFNPAELERDLGRPLSGEAFDSWLGKPVLVARVLRRSEG